MIGIYATRVVAFVQNKYGRNLSMSEKPSKAMGCHAPSLSLSHYSIRAIALACAAAFPYPAAVALVGKFPESFRGKREVFYSQVHDARMYNQLDARASVSLPSATLTPGVTRP